MTWQPVPTVTAPHYLDTNLNQVQKCVNWYHEKTPDGFVLKSLPGYQSGGSVANNAACRGSKYASNPDVAYSVHGNKVYLIDYVGNSTEIGTLLTSSGSVVIALGLSQAMIVDGTYGYAVNYVTNAVTQIVDANFPATPISCACFNGQFLAVKGGTDRWYMSAVDDAMTWTPIISGRAISNGDKLIHVEVVRDVVYFMGNKSIEPWSTSTIDPYLQPISGATMPVGLPVSPVGVSRMGDDIFFYGLGERSLGSFWRISGGQLSEIATPFIKDKVSIWGSGTPSRTHASAAGR